MNSDRRALPGATIQVEDSTLAASWAFSMMRAISSRQPLVLMYHGVPRRAGPDELDALSFEKQVLFLKEHFEVVRAGGSSGFRRALDRIQVVLTFDDGFMNNADVVAPILVRHQVPALFFVSSRHAQPGKYLWFSYLRMLERRFPGARLRFRGETLDMTPGARARAIVGLRALLLGLRPHPAAMYRAIDEELPRLEDFVEPGELRDHCAGLTAQQLAAMARERIFRFGAHTVDHPFLTRCDAPEMERQLAENRRWIEHATGMACDTLAYPGGDYDGEVLQRSRSLGFSTAYAVDRRPPGDEAFAARPFEIPRMGVYRPSLPILGFKVQWGNLLRRTSIRIG